MNGEGKPTVLIVYFTLTKQSGRVADAMAQAFEARGCGVAKAPIEFTDERWVSKLSEFPMKHPMLSIPSILPAQARHKTGEIRIPPEAQAGDYDLIVLASPTWWFQTSMPMRSYLESPEAKTVMDGKPFACVSISRRYRRFNLGQQRKLGEKNGGRWIDKTYFVSDGGQVKSMLAWLGYMKHGEPQERVFLLKMYPPNLGSDFEEQAKTFADSLVDGVLQQPAAGDAAEVIRWTALAGLLFTLSLGATACGSDMSSTKTASTAKRGVVTIPVATVGDPGNPSVGVWQVFKTVGASGTGVTLPPDNSTGIYKNCDAAPASAPSCLTVGGVKDTYGIGEFEITVSQYVTFLNTVDPDGKNLRQLYEDNMSSGSGHSTARSTTPPTRISGSTTPSPIPSGLRSLSTSGTSVAGRSSSTRCSTALSSRRLRPLRAASSTSPTRCGSRRGPSRACTT